MAPLPPEGPGEAKRKKNMIASHDSFTYLPATTCVAERLARLWRTQCDDIGTQYASGVRCFDIRVRRQRRHWRLCHGIVDLRMTFPSLDAICQWMASHAPKAIYRIVLERGSDKDFREEARWLCQRHPALWRVDVKATRLWRGTVTNNNLALYNKGYAFACGDTWEPPAQERHGKLTLANARTVSLREEARRINATLGIFDTPEATAQAAASTQALHLIDYATNTYR